MNKLPPTVLSREDGMGWLEDYMACLRGEYGPDLFTLAEDAVTMTMSPGSGRWQDWRAIRERDSL